MGDGLNVPTCVLKVNVHCCAACPIKLKKKLQKINGVYAIDIDAKNELVYVQGTVQPSILIQTITEKFAKKAEICAYEKNPNIQNQGNSSPCKYEKKNQTCSFSGQPNDHDNDEENNHDRDAHSEVKASIPEGAEGSLARHHPQSVTKKKKSGFGRLFGKKTTFETRMFGNFGGPRPGYARLPPPPPPPLPPTLSPPPLPPPSYRDGQYQTPPSVYFYSPPAPYRTTKPPRPYPYDFYEKKEPPVGNSVFHSFRDDNVNACSIV